MPRCAHTPGTSDFVVEGAREHALPVDYITNLESIDAVRDADAAARDRRKRALARHEQA